MHTCNIIDLARTGGTTAPVAWEYRGWRGVRLDYLPAVEHPLDAPDWLPSGGTRVFCTDSGGFVLTLAENMRETPCPTSI